MSDRGYRAHRLPQIAIALLAVAVFAAACSGAAPAPVPAATLPAPRGGVTAVKLAVDEDGLYEVTAAELRKAGFDLAATPKEQLSLTTGGTPIAFDLVGSGQDAALRFEALALSRDSYTPRNVYWLRSGEAGAGQQPAGPVPQPSATPPGAQGQAVLRLEEDLQYDTLAKNAEDRWYWQNIFAPATVEIPFTLSGPGDGAGELRMGVISKTSAPVDPDHRLLVSINGVLVTDAPWDGAEAKWITAPIAAGVLKDGENKLTINAPGTGAPADLVQLQRIEIAYPNAGAPAAEVARRVMGIEPVLSSNLPNWPGGADLVIVTAPQFHDALKPLVEAREKQGLRVAVVDAGQVYDAFSYGRTDPAAIQALMRYAREKWAAPAPRYLLLAGDASYDPLRHTQGTETDIVPTHVVHTAFSGWNGSDVWYALPDDKPTTLPAFAVGRFPAQTAEQLASMVSKTLAYESETGDLGWRSKALLVADNDEPGFADETAAFAKILTPYASEQVTVEGDGANARDALNRGFSDGAGLIGYFGHGSIPLWAKENVFDVKDAAKLNNERLPIVFTVTCLSGFFEHPSTVSLGETLLRQPGGGAVAALMPSSAAVLTDQSLLAQGLAAALAQPAPRSLGEIVLEAQRGLPEVEGGVRDILLTFNLLGDPSMKVAR